MQSLLYYLITPTGPHHISLAYTFLRIALALLTIGHGIPKILGGPAIWSSLGQAITVLGIHHFFLAWGLLAAAIEFFGGIALLLGFMTRIASFLLTCMMLIAFFMHVKQGDTFTAYSFPLSLAIIFIVFTLVGGGSLSIDGWVYARLQSYWTQPHNTNEHNRL